MSGRGRGRGGGGGRGQPHRDQPQSASSSGRGGGTGGGRGRGRGEARGRGRGRGRGRESVESTGSPAASHYSSVSEPSSSSATNLSRDIETKLTLGAPAPSQPAPTVPPPVQPSRSAEPQPSSSQVVQSPPQLPPSSSKSQRPPARPGFGTIGQKCVVRANHFLVKIAERDLHHYDVSIDPEVSSKKVCREIIGSLADAYRESHLGRLQLAYDGNKNIYTAGPLPFNSKDFIVKLVDNDAPARRERQFTVAIKFVGKPDLHHLQQFLARRQFDTPQEIIQVLDVVLRTTPSKNYSVVGRSFFAPKLGRVDELGDGLLCYKGFYQSLRPTQLGLSLNIDMSARAFYEPILVIEFVAKYLNVRDLTRSLSDQDRIKVKKALKGVRIELDRGESVKRYKITGVSTLPMSQLMFPLDDGRTVSVLQYFRERYNINLRYAFLPALQAGSDNKPAYLPMEISKIIEGQRYSRKLNEKQVTAMLRATCQRPVERERSIKQMVARNNYNNDACVNEFGLQIRSELTVVDARILPPPTLMYHHTGAETRVNPNVGQWNMINKKMVNGGSVDFWTCVTFSRTGQDQASIFCAELVSMCISKGIVFNRNPLLPTHSAHPGNIEKVLCEIHARSNAKLESSGQRGKCLQLLIIILPDSRGSYGTIKRVCETELGLVSQCCQPKHVSRLSKQYLENVALKINVKVGGRNTLLLNALPLVTDQPTIIFGADVTHPQPGEDLSPSIAAVVASMDWPEVTKYRGLVSAQPHREEIILDLYKKIQDPQKGMVHGGMIRELLIAFSKSTNRKPCRIIFYRDGVSEGQFNQVLLYEMDAIRRACVSLEEDYLPPVTFVVVQKRHHTRLFPAEHNNRNMTDRSGNILPGTVVDTGICHPTEFDFYLCSHSGIQGTSRPTHYHVLYDENKFSADALQTLTNNLCYTYARCTRSVSIVPPAYYAHLAAFRARYYIEGETSESGSTSGGGSSTRDRNVDVRPLPAIRENVKDVMFYC